MVDLVFKSPFSFTCERQSSARPLGLTELLTSTKPAKGDADRTSSSAVSLWG